MKNKVNNKPNTIATSIIIFRMNQASINIKTLIYHTNYLIQKIVIQSNIEQ